MSNKIIQQGADSVPMVTGTWVINKIEDAVTFEVELYETFNRRKIMRRLGINKSAKKWYYMQIGSDLPKSKAVYMCGGYGK